MPKVVRRSKHRRSECSKIAASCGLQIRLALYVERQAGMSITEARTLPGTDCACHNSAVSCKSIILCRSRRRNHTRCDVASQSCRDRTQALTAHRHDSERGALEMGIRLRYGRGDGLFCFFFCFAVRVALFLDMSRMIIL